jgi:hypothetical protein
MPGSQKQMLTGERPDGKGASTPAQKGASGKKKKK